MNEMDKFFEGLPTQDKKVADVFEEPKKEEEVLEKEAPKEDESEGRKNRRHRRLEEQLARANEMTIQLNERVKVLSEVSQTRQEKDLDPRLLETFGDTEAGKKVAKNFAEILREETVRAKEEALKEFEDRQTRAVEEQRQYETLIDSELEALEDEHNVDLTSDAPAARKARREFLEMVQSLSPKDKDGTITGYADFESTFEIYQSRQEKPDVSRNKEIASRSMQRSGSVDTTKASDDSARNYLKSIGIRGI